MGDAGAEIKISVANELWKPDIILEQPLIKCFNVDMKEKERPHAKSYEMCMFQGG